MSAESTSQPDSSAVRKQFVELGLEDPGRWTELYFEHGPSTLATCVFLKAAWEEVVPPNDTGWLEDEIKHHEAHPDKEWTRAGAIIKQLLADGASKELVSELVRVKQSETLEGICGLIDNTGGHFLDPGNPKLHWHLSLFESCPADSVDLGGLHEQVEEFDPGRPPE